MDDGIHAFHFQNFTQTGSGMHGMAVISPKPKALVILCTVGVRFDGFSFSYVA